MADDRKDELDLQAILAAVLDNSQPLSEEEIAAFDALWEESDYSEDQRLEVTQTICNLVAAIIDFAWRHHPIQQAQGAAHNGCGKPIKSAYERPNPTASVVNSRNKKTKSQFDEAARVPLPERAS